MNRLGSQGSVLPQKGAERRTGPGGQVFWPGIASNAWRSILPVPVAGIEPAVFALRTAPNRVGRFDAIERFNITMKGSTGG